MKNKKLVLVLSSIVGLVIIFLLASKFYRASETKRLSFLAQSDFKTFVRDYSPKLGAENPQIYLTEFLDPECESCREFHPLVKSIMSDYEGKIQLIIRYAPFHTNSVLAVKILEAARKQNKYWETLETLFQYQPQWGSHHHPRPDLIWTYLPEAGVDVTKLRQDMNDPELDKIIEQDVKDGQTLGVRFTPTFFINGKPLDNFGYQELRNAIEAASKQQ